jgi:hypothetical protein
MSLLIFFLDSAFRLGMSAAHLIFSADEKTCKLRHIFENATKLRFWHIQR